MSRDSLMTVPEVAEFLRVARSSVYVLIDNGSLPYIRFPGMRSRRISRSAVEELIQRGMTGNWKIKGDTINE